MGGSGRSTLINAFVPFSAKTVTGRDIMEGNEDEFGILRNASASQLVSFSPIKGLQRGVLGHSVTVGKERVRGYLYAMENSLNIL